MKKLTKKDVFKFAQVLKDTKILSKLRWGDFVIPLKPGITNIIQYSHSKNNLLRNYHNYTLKIGGEELQVSLQLYKNVSNHYRLFAFCKYVNNAKGLLFSINLTTEKESGDSIFLFQKIKFQEQFAGHSSLAKVHRSQKQNVMCDILFNMGYDITESNNVLLGIFDPEKGVFVNTTQKQFINDFLVVSILKGHFQGNKGYQIGGIPQYLISEEDTRIVKDSLIDQLPQKIIDQKSKRTIPLSYRVKILERGIEN